MAMTVYEILDFCSERTQGALRGLKFAQTSGNYHLAAFNCDQAFKYRLMKSLIEWRMGTDPSESLSEVLNGFSDDWRIVCEIGGDEAKTIHVPAERVAFVACLINQPCPINPCSDGLQSVRLLDFVLGTWLITGSWDDELWELGMKQLCRPKRPDLLVRSYELYKAIVDASGSDLPALSQEGEKLFAKRKSDKHYGGAEQTEGGYEDNDITVDYRLAALLKRAGYVNPDGIHVWKWG